MTEFDPHAWAEATITDAINSLGPDPERIKAALEALHRAVARRLPEDGEIAALSRAAQAEAEVVELRGALERAEEYHLEPRCAPNQYDAEFYECDICYEVGGNDLPPVPHNPSVVLTTGERGCPFAALRSPSPVAEALGRVVRGAEELAKAGDSPAIRALIVDAWADEDFWNLYTELEEHLDALQAARSGRGEGRG